MSTTRGRGLVIRRRMQGLAFLVVLALLLGLSVALYKKAFTDVAMVTLETDTAGSQLQEASDVKVRGVIVGEVGEITLTDDLQALAEIKLHEPYDIPERSQFVITNKTLLGEKQIEVRFDGAVDEGPFVAHGDLIDDPDQVVEFENVLGTLSDLAEAIDPDDLVTVVDDFFGAFDGQGPAIARSIDEGSRAAAVFERSLDDQMANNRDLSLVAAELSDDGDTFNRLGRATVQGMPTLSENQAEIRTLLDELSAFSDELDTTFTLNRRDLDRMIISGDNVIRLLGRYDVELGQVMTGLVGYTEKFGPGFQYEGIDGQAARFIAFLKHDIYAEICLLPEPLRSEIPECAGRGGGGGGGGQDPPDLPIDLPDLPDLPGPPGADADSAEDLLSPQGPAPSGLDSILSGPLTAGGALDG